MQSSDIYQKLRYELKKQIVRNGLYGRKVKIRTNPLSPEEAIGEPEDNDYPLMKGKERMIEAVFGRTRVSIHDELGNA